MAVSAGVHRLSSSAASAVSTPFVSVIVPTKEEADNVAPLLERLVDRSRERSDIEVIFVDDSDDNTADEIRDAGSRFDAPVSVIHRPAGERAGGLATAVIAGFAAARGLWLCVMDADLQHPPEVITQLIGRAQEGDVDMVVASRFVDGGSADDFGALRSLLSHFSSGVARLGFRRALKGVSDPMSGFFLVSRAAVAANLPRLRPRGSRSSSSCWCASRSSGRPKSDSSSGSASPVKQGVGWRGDQLLPALVAASPVRLDLEVRQVRPRGFQRPGGQHGARSRSSPRAASSTTSSRRLSRRRDRPRGTSCSPSGSCSSRRPTTASGGCPGSCSSCPSTTCCCCSVAPCSSSSRPASTSLPRLQCDHAGALTSRDSVSPTRGSGRSRRRRRALALRRPRPRQRCVRRAAAGARAVRCPGARRRA